MEGAVKSHTRKALDAGCTLAEVKQTALIALPTIGFPSTVAILSWMETVIEKRSEDQNTD